MQNSGSCCEKLLLDLNLASDFGSFYEFSGGFSGKKDFGWDSCTDGKVRIFFCAQGLLSFTESNILSLLASLRLNPKSSKIGDFISRLK